MLKNCYLLCQLMMLWKCFTELRIIVVVVMFFYQLVVDVLKCCTYKVIHHQHDSLHGLHGLYEQKPKILINDVNGMIITDYQLIT